MAAAAQRTEASGVIHDSMRVGGEQVACSRMFGGLILRVLR